MSRQFHTFSIFSYASSSSLYPCDSLHWVEFQYLHSFETCKLITWTQPFPLHQVHTVTDSIQWFPGVTQTLTNSWNWKFWEGMLQCTLTQCTAMHERILCNTAEQNTSLQFSASSWWNSIQRSAVYWNVSWMVHWGTLCLHCGYIVVHCGTFTLCWTTRWYSREVHFCSLVGGWVSLH